MELCDKYLHELIKINPTINDYFLFDEYLHLKHILPDIYSEKHYKKLHDLDLKYKKILKKKKNHNIYDKILLRNINYDIHMETEYEIYMYMPIGLNDNILVEYVTETSGNGIYNFKKRKDYLDFLKRLKTLPVITNEIITKMKDGMKNKVCLPRKTVDKMINNLTDILKNKSYDNNYKQKPIEWNSTVEKYLVKSLDKLHVFLINEYYPYTKDNKLGLSQYKGGKIAYKKIVQYKTFSDITPEMIYNLGYTELKRLLKEKKRLQNVLKLNNIDDTLKKYVFKDEKSILKTLKEIQKEHQTKIYPKYFHGDFPNKDLYDIKPISIENKHMFAYYDEGDLKETKKGTFYINTFNPEIINKYELYVLSLHEGIPGHHLQILKTKRSNKPYYLKFGDEAYSEGWALYCENLGEYKDDYNYYFKLNYEILRSLRLILDPAIHYYGWNYDKCYNLLKENLPHFTDMHIEKSILRYMNDPGQAITYKIGEKAFLYTLNKLLNKGYNIKDIHQKILDYDVLPIELLVDIIN